MDHDFWHNKWDKNEIGFHEPNGNALLVKYASYLLSSPHPRIFVPLCGKSLDIHWLLANGCEVIGAELSELAIKQLFKELNIAPLVTQCGNHLCYSADKITIFVGDFFQLSKDQLGKISSVYDRAAMVALPDQLRRSYAAHLTDVTNKAPMLVISFSYDQSLMEGPPFSVTTSMVKSLYPNYKVELIEQSAAEEKLKGKVDADNLVFYVS